MMSSESRNKIKSALAGVGALSIALLGLSATTVVFAAPPSAQGMYTNVGRSEKSEDGRNISYPRLGRGAPKVAVVFDGPYGEAKRAAIYVDEGGSWRLVNVGPYNRGSLLVGKGGQGNRFRLGTTDGKLVNLMFNEGRLELVRPGARKVIYTFDG